MVRAEAKRISFHGFEVNQLQGILGYPIFISAKQADIKGKGLHVGGGKSTETALANTLLHVTL